MQSTKCGFVSLLSRKQASAKHEVRFREFINRGYKCIGVNEVKINIYYGGRGLIGDPTLYVINKMQEVLKELNVTVERYVLYEYKNGITTLPQSLKDTDGVILATTVEWFGIGGWMQQFLDACWLYADKEKLSKMYMLPIVMSTTYGEREGVLTLENAWEKFPVSLDSSL